MRIDIINNSGIRTLAQELEEQMLTSNHFDLATAFITEEVLELIELFFNKNKTARLITGLYNCFNSKEVLVALQKLCAKHKGQLEVNISSNQRFHWKYYSFEHTLSTFIYCGSANFTGAGINESGEFVTKLSLTNKEKEETVHFKDTFNKEWQDSIPITSISFDNYKQNIQNASVKFQLDKSIKSLLKNNKSTPRVTNKSSTVRAIFINSRVSGKTEKILFKQRSTWDKDGLDFLCFTRKSDYEAALKVNRICVIYKEKGNYEFQIATVLANDIFNTTDGSYFILYKIDKELIENNDIRSKIEAIGLNYHSRNFTDKTLGKKQSEELLKILK